LTDEKQKGKDADALYRPMALETRGSGNILTDNFDGRRLELETVFTIGGDAGLDPQGADWEAQKLAYGRQIAIQAADQAVPQLLAGLGISGEVVPEYHVRHTGRLQSQWDIGTAGGNTVDIRQQVRGVFQLEGSREVSPGDLIMTARDNIAMALAENAVFTLEQRFEGKQASDTEMDIIRENGRIVDFQRREIPPAGEAPATAV
jgi:hypothetical protein